MKDVRIAMITCRCPAGDIRHNLDVTAEWTRQAVAAGAAVVCFPELNLCGYGLAPDHYQAAAGRFGDIVKVLSGLAGDLNIMVLAGTVKKDSGGNALRACHLVVHPDGRVDIYNKLHIAPPEMPLFVGGETVPLFDGPGFRFGVQLCYDAHFPELSTRMALDGVDLIFFPHASPRGQSAQDKFDSWMRHLTARAFDNGLFVAACNQSGDNGDGLAFPGVALAIGPDGREINRLLTDDGMLVVDLSAVDLAAVRDHRMRYFLPNRRPELYGPD